MKDPIFQRVSVRKFTDAPVTDEQVERLLRAAMAAPSATNQQPWEFYVVRDPEKLMELSRCHEYSMCVKNATLALVPCYRKEARHPEYLHLDLSAATENILLEAVQMGLGGTWLGIAPVPDRMAKMREILDLPEGLEAFAIVPLGQPERDKPRQDRYDPSRVHTL
ncbi:nitroreductase family protein [Pseudoflavonifractor sp. MSJ-37]|uniref:nitroreductase family protein n=1 Tax=Pseudoflavonifractor sp. MSJ-37 TaxID=2841531 RepID=UPI001C115E59|nr:nitroreductase family protein [Pseudoflavonifractor sp. MSJ-37]MBU5434296.1 nitroreductase family protein [Pseudoflavonifractor sp. MSJ-37]